MRKIFLLLFVGFSMLSCEKKEDNTQAPPPPPNSTIPNLGDNVDAVMVSLNVAATVTLPFVGTQTVFQGLPFAQITDNTGAGTISCEGQELDNRGSGTYIFTPSQTAPNGIEFDRPVAWSVAGGSGSVGAFTYNHEATVPEIADVTGDNDGSVDLSANVTIGYNTSLSTLGSADSLYFVIIDKNGNTAIKKTSRTTTSVVFTPAELSDLAGGEGYIQVNAFTYEIETLGGASIAFIAQGSSTKGVQLK